MITNQQTVRIDRPSESRPTVWGLSADELHDAYWGAQGVQVLRRASFEAVDPNADLYLLIESDQMVLFDLKSLVSRIAWRAASLTRLRVVSASDHMYSEHVKVDDDGRVDCVSREYFSRGRAAYRVLLTRRRGLAYLWVHCGSRRYCWTRIRAKVRSSDIDNWRCEGGCFTTGDCAEERRMIDHVVSIWPDPCQAIDGLDEIRENVWSCGRTVPLQDDAVLIGPVWLGRRADLGTARCFIGPTWIEDAAVGSASASSPARVRRIRDIDPADQMSRPDDQREARQFYLVAKRTFDLAASMAGLIVLSPLIVFISLLTLIFSGRPVFYGHVRQTRGGRNFRCWKFRTMVQNAEAIKAEVAAQNACDGPQFFIQNDPRVTRIGRILRKYHLDELPQLWNVLRGQMSLVGPRPSPDAENQICAPWRELRLSVRPGITGLWQLRSSREPGRDFQEWIRFDTEYVERATFWLDLKIIIATVLRIARRAVP
jgi:lipopolysaccharide/colanic/teichoic acid biosynthesis glycosyltransferase